MKVLKIQDTEMKKLMLIAVLFSVSSATAAREEVTEVQQFLSSSEAETLPLFIRTDEDCPKSTEEYRELVNGTFEGRGLKAAQPKDAEQPFLWLDIACVPYDTSGKKYVTYYISISWDQLLGDYGVAVSYHAGSRTYLGYARFQSESLDEFLEETVEDTLDVYLDAVVPK